MSLRQAQTDKIKLLRRDDLAKQLVLRFQQDPTVLDTTDSNPALREMRSLCQRVLEEARLPDQIAEWIAVGLYIPNTKQLTALCNEAQASGEVSYVQSEQWLRIINEKRQQNDSADGSDANGG
ncbi:MAG: hypothetical protein AAF125_11885 [Chloroflexota bacterium]